MGQFAIIGILTIILSFIFLTMGIGTRKGSFEYEEIKIAGPICAVIFMFGFALTLIP